MSRRSFGLRQLDQNNTTRLAANEAAGYLRALDIDMPPTLLSIADEVIE